MHAALWGLCPHISRSLLQAFYEASDAVSWAVETQQVRWRPLLASVSMQLSCASCCKAGT